MDKDEFIISQLKQGNEDAYRYIFSNEYEAMCGFAFGMLHDRIAAEEIADDVIYSLWMSRESLCIKYSLHSYLIGAVRNRCVNKLKSRQRFVDIDPEADFLKFVFTNDHPLGMLLEKELEQRLAEGISKLPAESRRVFEMSRFEDKTYVDIAKETGKSVNTVKYHIKTALSMLQSHMHDYLLLLLAFFFLLV